MKLRTRLTLGSVAVLTAALVISCFLFVRESRRALLEDALDYTLQEARQLADNLERRPGLQKDDDSSLVRQVKLRYFFAQQAYAPAAGSSYILQKEDGEMLYNDSGIDAVAALRDGETVRIDEWNTYSYTTVWLEGREYCVVGIQKNIWGEKYLISVARDITDHMARMRMLTWRCAAIGAVLTLAAAVITACYLAGTLRPLKRLQKNALAVAEGDYSQRLSSSRKDELGSLACSFDKMSEAVGRHIRKTEEAAQEKKLLLSALSHEMRTPITAITGYAYALKAVRMSEDQKEEAIDFIDRESRRLERLSSKLAGLVSLDSREVSLTSVKTERLEASLRQILKPLLQRSTKMGQESAAHLELDFAAGSLLCEEDLLLMLVTNLVDNARKAGATEIVVSLTGGVLSVADNGCGIPEDQLEQVAQPFYQVDASRSQEGFGLGLALCCRIAQLHGARLEIASEVGKGSVFTVNFYNSFTTP